MHARDIVAQALEAFNRHDLDQLMTYFAPGYHLVVHSKTPFELTSADQARAVFAAEFAEAPDRRSEINKLIESGPYVVALVHDILTHPQLGPLDVPVAMVFEVRDGLIAGCEYYQDTAFWMP